ncbi:efflux RND transporter periplasmic adaptor subunit [Flavihumibacter petaseus]|uniref:Putative RND-type efflux pump membrane fusion protein n=1 Tax=Flavihumibacter petaseus NBRC 106054 TaxID=1220578 RepID=A0A0E9N419_9BACT|nr:efflux RND transporter periplasmic adaptor subunit [Flavihumibacter petaseus]GAO44401.1 putative RND-type efflux pump membrane fusion protein [Flavihumibacter petaseus NBRC 106054]
MTFQFSYLHVLIGGAIILQCACSAKGHPDNNKQELLKLPVVTVQQLDTLMVKSYVADLQALQNVEIRAKIQGFLEEIMIDEGQAVTKGQPLFRINDAELRNQVSQANALVQNAEAEAETARLEETRVKKLVEKNIISASELSLAAAKVKSAEARVQEAKGHAENARIRLSYAFIRSPFTGVIDRLPFKVGSLVDEGSLLTTISNLDAIYAYFNVSENEYLHFMKSKEENKPSLNDIGLTLADGSRYPQTGVVETMESIFDEKTGSIAFRAKFPNPDRILKHGATGKVSLTRNVADVMMVPQKAVFEIQDKNYVFVMDSQHTVKMRDIRANGRMDQYLLVADGLQPGETIVSEGIQQIRDGSVIQPRYINQAFND